MVGEVPSLLEICVSFFANTNSSGRYVGESGLAIFRAFLDIQFPLYPHLQIMRFDWCVQGHHFTGNQCYAHVVKNHPIFEGAFCVTNRVKSI